MADKEKTVNLPSGDKLTQKVMAKRERIASLPEEIRQPIIDRLFELTFKGKKNLDEESKSLLKRNYTHMIMGESPEMSSGKPTEADFKRQGMATGPGGRLAGGLMSGLGNLWELVGRLSGTGEHPIIPSPEYEKSATHKQEAKIQSGEERALQEAASAHLAASSAYAGRHPFKAGAAELVGQGLPSIPLEAMVPGAPPGLGMAGKAGLSALRGGIGMMPFDPSLKGAAIGAGLGAGTSVLGGAAKSLLKGAAGKLAKRGASTAAAKAAEDPALKVLNELSQKTHGKPFDGLSPDQKTKIVKDWTESNITEKKAAASTARAAKVQEKVKAASARVDDKVAVRRAMDEAKNLQRGIREFVKANKRAPDEAEIAELRKAPVQTVGTAEGAKADTEFFQKAKEQLGPNASISDVAKLAQELKTGQFKAENPAAMKAAAAVVDVRNAAEVVKVPEGQHGTGLIGQRAKDAERKAAERAQALAEQPEPEAPGTPETALMDKEEHLMSITDKMEEHSEKGKQAAKNLFSFYKKGTITLDQAIMMGEKSLEVLGAK